MNNDRILLVTGASSEVGLKLLVEAAGNYGKIWAHYRSEADAFEGLKSKGNIAPIQADFSSEESARNFIEKIEKSGDYPDQIVHISAHKAYNLRFHKNKWDNYRREIDISQRSIVMILNKFIPKMAKKKYGRIVFMLTSYLFGIPPKFQSSYVTVKYALLGFMKSLSAEYASKGIAVNAISPDMMETKFLSDLPHLIVEQSAKTNPLERNIDVGEAVSVIKYLLGAESPALTGQNIAVTGGVR